MTVSRRTTPTGWNIRWDDVLATQARADGWWSDDGCGQALRGIAAETPDQILIIDGDSHLSAIKLLNQAEQLGAAMLNRFAPGSVISFMLPNWHEAAIIYFGATLAGMVVNPILPSLREHDLRFILADVQCKMVFIPHIFRKHDYVAMMDSVSANMAHPPEVVVVRGGEDGLAVLLNDQPEPKWPPFDPDDVRMVMYTSGTTGRPKGVMHTHNSLNALIRQISAHWLIEKGDRFLVPSPISHIGGSIYAFECPVLLGTSAILMESWSAEAALPLMEVHRITHMAGATPFLQQLLNAAHAAGTHLPELKLFICGGASVPPSLIQEANDWFDKAIVSRVYGSTELPVTTVGTIDAADVRHSAETDGRAGIATIIIAEQGEIRAKGPQLMLGYVHVEDEISAFDAQGFYRTGDQGEIVDGDFLVVTGRIKDLIIRNGENIAPKEIEDLLANHHDISEIAIVGIPDAKTGERAVAVIVPTGAVHPDVVELGRYLSGFGVAKFKYPEEVLLWDHLPKNDAGKVLKVAIRQRLTAEDKA